MKPIQFNNRPSAIAWSNAPGRPQLKTLATGLLVPLAFVFVLVTNPQFASAIPITVSSLAPAVEIIESQTDASGGFNFLWTGNGNDQRQVQGQSFRHTQAGGYTAKAITVVLNPSTNAATFNSGIDLHIRLYPWNPSPADTGGAPVGHTGANPGTLLVPEMTGTLPGGWVNNTPRFLTFDIDDVNLNSNQQYGFVVDYTTAVAPGSGFSPTLVGFLHGSTTDASYPKGTKRLYREHASDQGGDIDYDAGDDLAFYIQGVAIPEPSTFALAGIGIVGLIASVRRQRR